VSRVEAKSEVNKFEIELDVNTDIYPMEKDALYSMVITSSLTQDASEEFDIFAYKNEGSKRTVSSLLDEYQYVVHGKIFKYTINKDRISVYVSFGGLLMSITGNQKDLKSLEIDSRIYLLLKKT